MSSSGLDLLVEILFEHTSAFSWKTPWLQDDLALSSPHYTYYIGFSITHFSKLIRGDNMEVIDLLLVCVTPSFSLQCRRLCVFYLLHRSLL